MEEGGGVRHKTGNGNTKFPAKTDFQLIKRGASGGLTATPARPPALATSVVGLRLGLIVFSAISHSQHRKTV